MSLKNSLLLAFALFATSACCRGMMGPGKGCCAGKCPAMSCACGEKCDCANKAGGCGCESGSCEVKK